MKTLKETLKEKGIGEYIPYAQRTNEIYHPDSTLKQINEMANLGGIDDDKSGKLKVYVYRDEHGKAHLHIGYGTSKDYKFHLDGTPDTSISRLPKEIENNMPKIEKYILDNKDALENAFDELVNNDNPNNKEVEVNFEKFKGKSKEEIENIKKNDNKEEKTKGKCKVCGKPITAKNFYVFCSDECRNKEAK